MPEGLARYQLDKNPYLYARALDPLVYDDDKNLMVHVDGFGRIPTIDEYLRTAIDNNQAAFFMITGRSGTGRSSFANYVLKRYCELRGKLPGQLIVPAREYKGHNQVFTIKKWFGFLRTEINRRRIDLDDQVKRDLQMYIRDTNDVTLEPDFQDIALRLNDEIGIAGHIFACCMENVEDYNVIDAALSIFNGVQTACIFTVDNYGEQQTQIVEPFRDKCRRLTGSGIFELSKLSAAEVRQLVEQRWNDCCALENPFDLNCIEEVFRDKHRTIGLTLTLVAALLDDKLVHHPAGDEWPGARELGFTCEQLKKLVPLIEKRV